MTLPAVLCVGGSDPSAGAGVQADLRTLEGLGVAALTAVTAITVQDGRRLQTSQPVSARLVSEQIRVCLAAHDVRAIKCGLIPSAAVVRAVAERLARVRLPIVLDPVVKASAGARLARPGTEAALVKHLFPLAHVVTVNLEEAAVLTGLRAGDATAMGEAAKRIAALGAKAVVVKGGHGSGREVVDVLYDGHTVRAFRARRSRRGDLHGSGCAFAAALAAALAQRIALPDAVRRAGRHVRELLRDAEPFGKNVLLRRPPGSI